MIKKIQLIIIAVFIVILAIVDYMVYKNYRPSSSNLPEVPIVNNQQPDKSQETPKTEIKPPASQIFPGFRVYKNAEFGFEIQYPVSWIVTEEINENVRGEMVKEFYFKKPNSDLRFAILPKDGLSYGLPSGGISEDINIGGFLGVQTKYNMPDGRRLLLVHPQVKISGWDPEIGRLDIESSVENPIGDFEIFNKMLNSFKFIK